MSEERKQLTELEQAPRVLVLPRKRKAQLSPHVVILTGQETEQGRFLDNAASVTPQTRRRRWWSLRSHPRATMTGSIFVAFTLITTAAVFSAFEAHVINVTAKIEKPPSFCDARSPGYWRNHEGCTNGSGESIWTPQVNALSGTFSGVFAGFTGAQICSAVYIPACGPGNTFDGQFCRARAHLLTNELNVVSGHLDLLALLAGADDGSGAFNALGLDAFSTIGEALAAIEAVLDDPGSSLALIKKALVVASRIHEFYEFENPKWPSCIFDPDDVPQCFDKCDDECKEKKKQSEEESEKAHDDQDGEMPGSLESPSFSEFETNDGSGSTSPSHEPPSGQNRLEEFFGTSSNTAIFSGLASSSPADSTTPPELPPPLEPPATNTVGANLLDAVTELPQATNTESETGTPVFPTPPPAKPEPSLIDVSTGAPLSHELAPISPVIPTTSEAIQNSESTPPE